MTTAWKRIREGLEQVSVSGLKARLTNRDAARVRTHICRRCGQTINTELAHIRHCHICGTTIPPSAR